MPSSKKKRSKTRPSRPDKKKKKEVVSEKKKPLKDHSRKKETLHIGKIAPINILEQQELFFQSNCSINPILIYPEGSNLLGFTDRFLPHSSCLDTAISILDKCLLDYNSQSDFEKSGSPTLTEEESLEYFQIYLDRLGIRSSVEIVFSASAIAQTSVNHNPKTMISQIIVSLPIVHCKERIIGVMHHEIGTHLLRTMNERKQVWYKKREKFALSPYTETEEGLASLNTMIEVAMYGEKKPYLYKAALHYFSSYFAASLPFVELYKKLGIYMDDPLKRFKEVLRVKRGIQDTSKPGGCYKDSVYLSGAIKILKHRRNIDFLKLYCGKLALEDYFRPEIQQICIVTDIKHPVFLMNMTEYLTALDYIARVNGID